MSTIQSILQIACNYYQMFNCTFFYKNRKTNPKFIQTAKKVLNSKEILSKKNKVGNLTPPDFKICYRITGIKTVWC